jgi:hypothetical protein
MWDFGRIPNNPPLEQRTTEPPLKPIIHPSTLYQPGFFILYFTVLGSEHVHEASGEHYLTWEFLLFLGQLLFTVLGSGHVHEASGAHRLSNRADPWITSWLGAHHLLFGIPRIHPSWLTPGPGSDTTCKDYVHHLSPHWYDIVHFGPKPSWICSWAIPKRPHTNGDICPSLYTHDPPHF